MLLLKILFNRPRVFALLLIFIFLSLYWSIKNSLISKNIYQISSILFILALGGLSNQETARRGNLFGMIGMAVALIATMSAVTANLEILVGGLLIGATIGLILAKRVQMTQMPELVAMLHSLVGLAAVLVGYANFMDPERLQHFAEIGRASCRERV